MSTQDEFAREMTAQNDYLWQQLAALRRAPRKTWRRCRLHEVVCGGCGRPLVEVMDTRPYPIVLHRQTAEAPEAYGSHRRGDWHWFPISNPPPAPDSLQATSGIIAAVCDCRQAILSLGHLFDSLRRGEVKRVLPADTLS